MVVIKVRFCSLAVFYNVLCQFLLAVNTRSVSDRDGSLITLSPYSCSHLVACLRNSRRDQHSQLYEALTC